jgi:hypothetical protein
MPNDPALRFRGGDPAPAVANLDEQRAFTHPHAQLGGESLHGSDGIVERAQASFPRNDARG